MGSPIFRINEDLQLPVVVKTQKKGSVNIYIPDLEITIHGADLVSALAEAILKSSAIYYYNIERNVRFEFKTTFAQCEKLCTGKDFATFIGLTR